MTPPQPARRSFIDQLLRRGKPEDIAEEPDQALDGALERLTLALNENAEVVAEVRKRQSSGKLKLVLVEGS